MNECLNVKNFGPIREANLDIRDLTIFIGQQATGKSMAAQLLYFMRGIEELCSSVSNSDRRKSTNLFDPHSETLMTDEVLTALEWWLGNHSSVYARPDTSLSWCPNTLSDGTSFEITWQADKVFLNYFLETWLTDPSQLPIDMNNKTQVYIPAGRALYSYLSAAVAMPLLSRTKNRPDWPGYVFRFYQTLESTIKSLWEYQEQKTLPLWGDLSLFIQDRMERVLKGQVRYGPNAILLKTGGQTLRPDTIAAGQMEAWPFFAILEDAIHKSEAEKLRIYFDEPEAHLHPGAQKNMMEIVAALVRNGTQVVLTTHSPYILYALNNSLAAGEVLGAGRSLPTDIPEEIALLPQQVAAYCFNSEGIVRDIMDREIGLIDSAELNRVAEDLGSDFTSMQEQLLNGGPEEDA